MVNHSGILSFIYYFLSKSNFIPIFVGRKPIVSSVFPNVAVLGSATSITLVGQYFTSQTYCRISQLSQPTTDPLLFVLETNSSSTFFVSSSKILCQLHATGIESTYKNVSILGDTFSIFAISAGQYSNPQTLAIYLPPTILKIFPNTFTEFSEATITILGSNFIPFSIVSCRLGVRVVEGVFLSTERLLCSFSISKFSSYRNLLLEISINSVSFGGWNIFIFPVGNLFCSLNSGVYSKKLGKSECGSYSSSFELSSAHVASISREIIPFFFRNSTSIYLVAGTQLYFFGKGFENFSGIICKFNSMKFVTGKFINDTTILCVTVSAMVIPARSFEFPLLSYPKTSLNAISVELSIDNGINYLSVLNPLVLDDSRKIWLGLTPNPRILYLSKLSGTNGTSLIVTGEYFNVRSRCFFNMLRQENVYFFNSSILKCNVVTQFYGLLSVSISDGFGSYSNEVNFRTEAEPVFNSVFPLSLVWGSTITNITIIGANFIVSNMVISQV